MKLYILEIIFNDSTEMNIYYSNLEKSINELEIFDNVKRAYISKYELDGEEYIYKNTSRVTSRKEIKEKLGE